MTHRLTAAVVAVCLLPLAAGCPTVSFKAGASPERMQADEHACGQGGDEGFVQCMRNLGYYVTDGAIGSPDTSPPPAAPVAAEPVAAAPAAASATAPPTATPIVPPPPVSPSPTAITTTPAPATAAPAMTSAPAAAATSSGLPSVRVGSWWKLGGSAAALDSSIATCTQKLGEPHRPAPNAQVVTLAMRDCLRGDGWFAYNVTDLP